MARRITTMLLVILLLAGIMPSAFAAEGTADGEEAIVLASAGSTVTITVDRNRQVQWIGHSDANLNLSYQDATGTTRGGYMTAVNVTKVDGVIAYCIEPCVEFGSTYTEDEAAAAWMSQLTANQRSAIALAMAYGYPNTEHPAASDAGVSGDTSLEYPLRTDLWQISERYAATQIIIWEIVTGKRSAVAPYSCTDDSLYTAFYCTSNPYGYRADWNTLRDTYKRISDSMAAHKSVPSFSSSSLANASTHELTYNSATGKYEATLTDTNQVLSGYDFQCSISGVTFTRSGNALNISATEAAAAQLNGVTVSAAGTMLDIDPEKVVAVWAAQGAGQTAVTLKSSPDPVTAYFKLKAEATTEILIKKTTNTGENLSGWKIDLYTDSGCTQKVSGSPFTTGADGTVTVPNLTPGTYYAKEVGSTDPYWVSDTETKTVNAEAGKTATVTFSNTHYGDLRVKKNAINGSAEGWKFQIHDADGSLVQTITTGADGYAYSRMLLPGDYTVKEIHDKDDTYWTYDATVVKQTQITAGEQSEVEYTNEQFGLIEFRKTTNTQNHLAGWTFKVKDSSGNLVGEYVTDGTGYACTSKLKPGRYYVQEVGSSDPYWICDVEDHPVDVTAGKTVGHSATNIEQGKGTFHKTTNTGANLDGWKITIYGDDERNNLIAVVTTDENGYGELYLEPGTYYAEETGDTKGRFEDEHWVVDTRVQEFKIEAHKDTPVTFVNTHYGKGKVIKTVDTDGSVEGWQFKITDANGTEIEGSPFVSDKYGNIITGNLLPGTYTVEELIPEDSLYYCKTQNPQTITIVEGKTVSVSFTNALRPGKISVEKVNTKGEHLAGAVFLLEWSKDGTDWSPVIYSDSADVILGGCSNPDLKDGCLTTGTDGLVEWDNLYPGVQYRITEVEAPEGYVLLTDYAFEGELPVEDLTVTLTVVNSFGFEMPMTGSNGVKMMAVAQILCFGMCAVMLLLSRKRS